MLTITHRNTVDTTRKPQERNETMMTRSKRWLLGLACVGLFIWAGQSAQAIVLVGSYDRVLQFSDTGIYQGDFIARGAGGLRDAGDAMFMPGGDLLIPDYPSNSALRYAGPNSDASTPGTFLGTFASLPTEGTGNLHGIAFGSDGNLYATSGGRILRYSGSSGELIDIPISGLAFPVDIDTGPDGMLYVASRWGRSVLQFDPFTDAIEEFVLADGGGLDGPTKLLFTADDTLLVTSNYTDQILRYDAFTGEFLGVFADTDAADLLELPNGDILLGVPGGVDRYDADGNFLSQFSDANVRSFMLHVSPTIVPEPTALVTWSLLSMFGYLAFAQRKRKQ